MYQAKQNVELRKVIKRTVNFIAFIITDFYFSWANLRFYFSFNF